LPRLTCHFCLIAAAVLAPSPAFAADVAVLPEPSGLVLLGIGVAGVWLGRRFSRGKDKD
jgi:hypothetical protein